MTALGIEISTRDEDKFYWTEPSWHGKPCDLLEVESKIDKLEARYIRLSDVEPLPWAELGEIEDEIKVLNREQSRLWHKWQLTISEMRKEQVAQ